MDDISGLAELFDRLRERLVRAATEKRLEAIKKATTGLKNALKLVEPTQKELKGQLLINKTAMKIRTLWNRKRKLIDLNQMAKELGLTQKKPTMDHVILAHYYPHDRLEDLAKTLEAVGDDGAQPEVERFQQWRGELRALRSQEDVAQAVGRLLDREGQEVVRRFAFHLNTRELSGKRRLPKSASVKKLVEAVAAHLWKERMVSKVQEGTA